MHAFELLREGLDDVFIVNVFFHYFSLRKNPSRLGIVYWLASAWYPSNIL